MKSFEEIFSRVQEVCKSEQPVADTSITPKGIRLHPADLHAVCMCLREDPALYFDMLSCITAVDNGVEAGAMEVVYTLYSIPFDHHVSLKVVLQRADPVIGSVSDIWKTANWHEREAWDLLGVRFTNHPDLRRILLPADWEGHPLRKDYKEQEYYRGIKVAT